MIEKNNKKQNNFGLSKTKFLRVPIENPEALKNTALKSIKKNKIVHFLSFWGLSHLKTKTDIYDEKSMAFLNLLISQIGYHFSAGVRLTILFGDVHARANNIPEEHICNYFKEVKQKAINYNFDIVKLSTLFTENGEIENYGMRDEIFDIYSKNKKDLEQAALNAGNKKDVVSRVLRYLSIREQEKKIIERSFQNSILLVGDRPKNKYILPKLPTLFTYTTGPKKNHKAWFLVEKNHKECVE